MGSAAVLRSLAPNHPDDAARVAVGNQVDAAVAADANVPDPACQLREERFFPDRAVFANDQSADFPIHQCPHQQITVQLREHLAAIEGKAGRAMEGTQYLMGWAISGCSVNGET